MEKQETNKKKKNKKKGRVKAWFKDHATEFGLGLFGVGTFIVGYAFGFYDGDNNGLQDGLSHHFEKAPDLIDASGKLGYFSTRVVAERLKAGSFDDIVTAAGGEKELGDMIAGEFYSDPKLSSYLKSCDDVKRVRSK